MVNPLRNRKALGGAAFAGTLAVIAGITVTTGQVQDGSAPPAQPVVAAPASAPTTTKTVSQVEKVKEVKRVKATPEGLLVTLLDTLPEGKTKWSPREWCNGHRAR